MKKFTKQQQEAKKTPPSPRNNFGILCLSINIILTHICRKSSRSGRYGQAHVPHTPLLSFGTDLSLCLIWRLNSDRKPLYILSRTVPPTMVDKCLSPHVSCCIQAGKWTLALLMTRGFYKRSASDIAFAGWKVTMAWSELMPLGAMSMQATMTVHLFETRTGKDWAQHFWCLN